MSRKCSHKEMTLYCSIASIDIQPFLYLHYNYSTRGHWQEVMPPAPPKYKTLSRFFSTGIHFHCVLCTIRIFKEQSYELNRGRSRCKNRESDLWMKRKKDMWEMRNKLKDLEFIRKHEIINVQR